MLLQIASLCHVIFFSQSERGCWTVTPDVLRTWRQTLFEWNSIPNKCRKINAYLKTDTTVSKAAHCTWFPTMSDIDYESLYQL